MSELAGWSILGVVLLLLVIAVITRNWHVKDFKLNQRARGFAEYVADTMIKQPGLRNSHGFYVQPELSKRAVAALKAHFRRNVTVTHSETNITIVYNNATWTIPICSDREYTTHYI